MTPDPLASIVPDGEILSLTLRGDRLTVVIKDWQEREHSIQFSGVAAVESLDPVSEPLSHCQIGAGRAAGKPCKTKRRSA